jgi:hypothetical protein
VLSPGAVAASHDALVFNLASGILSLSNSAAGASVQVSGTEDGSLTVTVSGQSFSSDAAESDFDPALAGAGVTTLRQISQAGGGPADALTLTHMALTGDLTIYADGGVTLAGDITIAGGFAITADSLTVAGAVRASSLALSSADLLDVEAGGSLVAQVGGNGGSITVHARGSFVNVGQVRADGAQGGRILLDVTDYLNAGMVSAAGSAGQGGSVQIAFKASYSDTVAALTTASGLGGAGGQVAVDGGRRLFSSGRFLAKGTGGGDVDLFGQAVFLIGGTVDGSGTAGAGGRVRVGGDLHGAPTGLPNAQTVRVSGTTVLRADGSGAGGRVVVWSEASTEFAGSVSASAGGLIEVSSHGQLTYSGTADAGAAGTLLLDPKDLVISAAGVFPQYQLPVQNGLSIPLSTGNIAYLNNLPGGYPTSCDLFNGQTGALISSLMAPGTSHFSVVTPLTNGNFVVTGLTGNATWGSGTTGISGVVSATNSFFEGGSQYVTPFVTPLSNGNYLLNAQSWNGAEGSVTWCDGTGPTTGTVSTTNSLIGTSAGDVVGDGGIFALANGNYVVSSPFWNNEQGAVSWGDGTRGVTGTISAANSLLAEGGTAGSLPVTPLTNGNYVVDNLRNAVTWCNGQTGLTGTMSAANSLVGDSVGDSGVTALTNGNYVVYSASWNNYTGAVTWCNGQTGLVDTVSSANSLIGIGPARPGLGYATIVALANGNYVVDDPSWNVGTGAVTWGNGLTGTVGVVSAANSLVGSNAATTLYGGDQVGGGGAGFRGVTALANGNYVVISPQWDGDGTGVSGTGAVTWGNGTTGTSGIVSAANSLVGSNNKDWVGIGGVTALSNGNYVVVSPYWGDLRGAATWGDGTTGITGAISDVNSLVGTTPAVNIGGLPPDFVGGGYTPGAFFRDVFALVDGNYVVGSPEWNNQGAATWADGTRGVVGTISAANSFLNPGTVSGTGSVPFSALPNGDYILGDQFVWFDGATGSTLDGASSADAQNRVVGDFNTPILPVVPSGDSFMFQFLGFPNPTTVYFTNPNLLTYALDQDQTITVTPDFITRTLDAGTNVTLQASDDIAINSPIIERPTGAPGSLTLQAGRSIVLNRSIDTAGGNLTLIANDSKADGVVDGDRDAGNAAITMHSGVTLNVGVGTLSFDLKHSTDKTNNGSGVVSMLGVTAASTSLSSASALGVSINGTTPGDGIAAGSYTEVNANGSLNLNGAALQLTHYTATAVGNTFAIIHSTGGVTGTFQGLAEGATVIAGDGTSFTISYQGNGGEDVVLTQTGAAPHPGQLHFNATSYTVNETSALASITISRIGGSDGMVTVHCATSDGTGTAGTNYTATSGDLMFAAGQTTQTFTIPILDDGIVNGDKTVNLTLSNPGNGATLGSPVSAVLTITEADAGVPGALQFSANTAAVHADAGNLSVTIVRTGGSAGSVSVLVATSDGSALAGTDYTAVSQTVTLGDGATQHTVSIPILNEMKADPSESFTVSLSQPTGGAVLGSQTHMLATITTEVGTPSQRYVGEVYQTLLLREPDQGGVAYWSALLDAGMRRDVVAASLTHSAEYYQTNVIKPAYQKYLNRSADAAGLAFWTTQLQNGTTDEQMQAGFIASQEFYDEANNSTTPVPRSPAADRLWVDALYRSLLGRLPDKPGEDFWTSQLQVIPPIRVANGFTGSQEGLSVRIQETYERYLGRPADQGGLAFWLAQYRSGAVNEDIVTGFIGSNEFFAQATV